MRFFEASSKSRVSSKSRLLFTSSCCLIMVSVAGLDVVMILVSRHLPRSIGELVCS